MPNWKKLIVSGSSAELSTLKLDGLSAQNSETDVLTINDSSVIGTRQLGSNAFNSTSYLTSINNSNWSGTDLSVANGGTGRSTLSSGQVLLGNGTSGINSRAIGIADNNIVEIDDADAADNDYAKFTANGLEGRSASEVKSDLSLNNVENTALSTYTGNGGALDNQYITNGANYVTAGVTLTTAAQTNITSLGTLTALTVDNVSIDGNFITIPTDGGLKDSGGTEAITFDDSANVTIGNGTLSVTGGSISISGDGSNAATLTESGTGDLRIDAVGDITLDADGADIILKDGGTAFGRFKRDTSDFVIKSETNDKDILFKGVDNNSTIEALKLDMSDGGAAHFSGNVYLGNVDTNTSSETTALFLNGSTNEVEKRDLGSNAFDSISFSTVGTAFAQLGDVSVASYIRVNADETLSYLNASQFLSAIGGTGNTGTVTSVGTNTGLSGTVTTSGNLSLALGDLADMTQDWVTGEDEFIVLDNGTQKRKLSSEIFGSNAFNSTAFTTNTGTVTSVAVTVGTGLDISGSPITTSGTIDIDLDLTEITLGAGLDSTATGLSLDLSELTDMTANVNTSQDELILLDNGAERRKLFSEIFGTAAYEPVTSFIPGNEDGPILLDATDGQVTSDTNLKWETPVLHVGTTSLGSSELRVQSSDTTQATISAYGNAQGTGRLYVGQSSTYGGGVLYNGDDNPDITSTTDKISFYRRNAGTDTEVFFYGYNSSTVNFVDDVVAFYSSDERLKTNIKPIENTLDKIDRIGGYNFDWVPKEGIHEYEGSDIGVIAQEIEKEFPELVTTRENGYKAVKYDKLTAVLLQAVKDLREEIRECKATK